MVVRAFTILEGPQLLSDTGVGSPTWLPGFIRCSRNLRLWVFLSGPFVFGILVSFAGPFVYYLQGAVACGRGGISVSSSLGH